MSTAGHEKPRGKLGRPRSKAKYGLRPIVNEYREGKVKSPPARGVKEFLNPSAYRQPEPYAPPPGGERVMACLLKNEPASYSSSRLSSVEERSASESESEQGARRESLRGPPRGAATRPETG